jgi:hypothetical protein
MRNVISPEEDAELKRLHEAYFAASKWAYAILARDGMESPQFAEADAAVGAVWRRIRKIVGTADSRWMA